MKNKPDFKKNLYSPPFIGGRGGESILTGLSNYMSGEYPRYITGDQPAVDKTIPPVRKIPIQLFFVLIIRETP
jgi:hypothetical protein